MLIQKLSLERAAVGGCAAGFTEPATESRKESLLGVGVRRGRSLFVELILHGHVCASLRIRTNQSNDGAGERAHAARIRRRAAPFDTHGRQIYHPRAMGQRAVAASARIFACRPILICFVLLINSCEKSASRITDAPPAKQPTVASLVP